VFPEVSQSSNGSGHLLTTAAQLVTSNNRALLRPAPIFPTTWRELYARTGALRDLPRSPRMYITAIK
jgi:hypothetical protein